MEGTCRWSTETSEYKTWVQTDKSSILWITGHAGSGKTTLTNFLIGCLQQTADNDRRDNQGVYHWFCTRDTETLRDARSLLRNLIVQILRSKQEIIRHIKRKFRADRYKLNHSFELLWNIFQAALACIPCERVFIVIDAIDECDECLRQRLLDRIFQSLRTQSGTDGRSQVVKYLISCQSAAHRRTWLTAPRIKHLHLEVETQPEFLTDLEHYLNSRMRIFVEDGLCSFESATFICRRLAELAELSFLWLRVILNEIERSLAPRYAEEDMERLMRDVPQSLSDAYSKYLPRVPRKDLGILKQYLHLIVASTRSLTIPEIDAFTNLERHPLGIPLAPDQVQATKSSLTKALGPLIQFPGTTAKLIHPSLCDYLLSIGSNPEHTLYQTHKVSREAAHGSFAAACIRYLLDQRIARNLFAPLSPDQVSIADSPKAPRWMENHQADVGDDDGLAAQEYGLDDFFSIDDVVFLQDAEVVREKCCEDIRRRLPAFDYAAMNWVYHYARCDHTTAKELEADSIALLSLDSDSLSNWYHYNVQQARGDMPSTQNGIFLAAFFNLPRVMQALLRRDNPLPADRSMHDALYWASYSGSTDCAAILLQAGVPAQEFGSTKLPLTVATRGGFLEICNLLLSMEDIDPNGCDDSDEPPLVIAAKQNHIDILAILLTHKQISCHKRDAGGRTALVEACRCNALESLEVLLKDGRFDVNASDERGRTALHHVSIAGDDRVLKRLLAEVDLDITAEDSLERNALSLAGENGHLDVVSRLHYRAVDIGAKDKTGRNAVSWAANCNKAVVGKESSTSVLEFMARKCSGCLDEPDMYGWSPLAWTLDPPGFAEAARILVTSGSVDVNRRDETGRSILGWAAGDGLVDITKILLDTPGIQKNSLTPSGKSPLASAATGGHIVTVKLLLDDPEVDILLRDEHGRTPADWARLNNHLEVVRLLDTAQEKRSSRDLF